MIVYILLNEKYLEPTNSSHSGSLAQWWTVSAGPRSRVKLSNDSKYGFSSNSGVGLFIFAIMYFNFVSIYYPPPFCIHLPVIKERRTNSDKGTRPEQGRIHGSIGNGRGGSQ